MKTAEKEAWEENFYKDVSKITKEIASKIKDMLSRDEGNKITFKDFKKESGIFYHPHQIYLSPLPPDGIVWNIKKPKVQWAILIRFNPSTASSKSELVNVSHRDFYTKQELERAKNQVLVKILEFFKLN
jgi:hypothetical protein